MTAKERRRLMRRRAWHRQVDKHRKNIGWMKRHDEWWEWERRSVTSDDGRCIFSCFVKLRPGPPSVVLTYGAEGPRITLVSSGTSVRVCGATVEYTKPILYK